MNLIYIIAASVFCTFRCTHTSYARKTSWHKYKEQCAPTGGGLSRKDINYFDPCTFECKKSCATERKFNDSCYLVDINVADVHLSIQ